MQIKLRAERRFGEVSRKLESKAGMRRDLLNGIEQVNTKKQVLADVGVSEQMNHQFEKLAAIPEQEFDF